MLEQPRSSNRSPLCSLVPIPVCLSNWYSIKPSAMSLSAGLHGTPKNEFEPDFTLNASRIGATWRMEWDSYYLIIPGQFAQTLKVGVSRRFGKWHNWVVSLREHAPRVLSGERLRDPEPASQEQTV
jgi:hypothetical protein